MLSRTPPRAALRLAFARCPAQQRLHSRPASTVREQFRAQCRKSPVFFPLAVTVIVVVSGMAALYVPWYYHHVIVKPYHNFPEPVAQKLRKALFYSRGKWLDLREANRHFRQALALADDLGMDPFSDEIMGVKYTIAALFEDAGYYSLAVDVLEIMRSDCRRWVDDCSHAHWHNGNRSRVLKNMVHINVKLAQLYDIRYVNEPDSGEKRLVEAVESALRERRRRETEGVKTGEGPWLTDGELGATLEALGTHYEHFDAHHLATPLFVKALELAAPTSCHRVVLMNNISACLAQQSPPPSADAPALSPAPADFPVSSTPPRALLIDQARQWATRALAQASTITPPDRNDECDVACAVATHNLGEFFEMEGRLHEARQKYQDAAKLAKAAGFAEGQTNARAALQRLKELEKHRA
ncbi:hypothetical protein BDU57DRAFT_461682 [Ampelomyces quisqualis]|uniref:TPR domain-containing protein n=1 Tax=Ampelomyces quisqualis TaxID=50730 RepID=A0A6A5Q7L9_AMPQU|nr:hypothetical protein BDU57DRAFT_461682 [Ampelomyces quisqualis]